MFNLRSVFAFLAVVAFSLAFAEPSRAQLPGGTSVTLPKTGVSHTRQNRGNNLLNTQINYDDCHLDDKIDFSVALSGYTGLTLQTWAGASCEVQDNRIRPNLLNCWQIGQGISPTGINPPAIRVAVRDILYGRTLASGASTGTSTGTAGSDGTGGSGGVGGSGVAGGTGGTSSSGTAGTDGSTAGAAGAASIPITEDAACTQKNAATGALAINVYFMLVDSANAIVGTYVTWPALYKLLAPPPPDNVSADIGENMLPIKFKYSTASSDTSINGYNLYCDPAPGTEAAADAGVLPDDAGPLPIPPCIGSTVLIAGERPNPANLCGNAGKSSSGGTATGLVNGVAYNVAVATTDSYGNTGVLSNTTCEVPQPVTGFFEGYRNAGGRGGGGFCSFSPRREPLPLLAVAGLATYLILRRRRAA
jgi:hypothetical protein